MKEISQIVRKYPLSCICIVVIWILCFCTPPHTPLSDISFIDKWTHLVMYGGTCAVIWVEYLRHHPLASGTFRWKQILIWGWAAPILMSGIIELLQAHCTGGRRSGEWLDFAANSTGATLALCGGILWVWYRARR